MHDGPVENEDELFLGNFDDVECGLEAGLDVSFSDKYGPRVERVLWKGLAKYSAVCFCGSFYFVLVNFRGKTSNITKLLKFVVNDNLPYSGLTRTGSSGGF